MPEIWLNYGTSEVVIDIAAENVERSVSSGGRLLDATQMREALGAIDTSEPADLILLHNTEAVQRAALALLAECKRRSHPIPRIMAEKGDVGAVRRWLPEGSAVLPYEAAGIESRGLVFVAEAEMDGLFGYETVATRLLRRFGGERMLSAYEKRKDDAPAPGQETGSAGEAAAFADGFEVRSVEVAASAEGITALEAGHPAKTMRVSRAMEASSFDVGRHKSIIISTGKGASSATLSRALNSLWSCSAAVKSGGTAIMVAECGGGLGSDALVRHIEGKLKVGSLRRPARYIDGMEDALYLSEIGSRFRIGLVSTLPEYYVKQLGIASFNSALRALNHLLRTHGRRQRILVASDGARTRLQ